MFILFLLLCVEAFWVVLLLWGLKVLGYKVWARGPALLTKLFVIFVLMSIASVSAGLLPQIRLEPLSPCHPVSVILFPDSIDIFIIWVIGTGVTIHQEHARPVYVFVNLNYGTPIKKKHIKEDIYACIYVLREKSYSFKHRNVVSVSGFGCGVLVCFGLDWCIARRLNGNRIHSGTAVAATAAAVAAK
jgi:hypothetical protein